MKKLLVLILLILSCGQTGPVGPQGTTGPQGPAGTSIKIVQLCPGSTNYPTTFVEVAFCIENQLWAVYSLNNGFETLIPPGYYSSNALNSSCNFYVHENCQISY